MSAIPSRGLAMIVDDEPINCQIIEAFLEELGFETLVAHDGYQAVQVFERQSPDFVFMDVIMPNMDGREATRRIKSMDKGRFTPVVFLTALDDPDELHACIEAGGDDFLSKPVNYKLLSTRILSLERMRGLYQKLNTQHHQLLSRLAEEEEHAALARRVFDHAVSARSQTFAGLLVFSRPASNFSGDLVLSSRLPDGRVRVLLADFTGHGLAAAIGALPVSELFHAMSRNGSSLVEMLEEMNQKLFCLLPSDRFMAAVLLDFQPTRRQVQFWSGGMPDVLISHHNTLQSLPSLGLPLGILEDYDFTPEIYCHACEPDSRLLMMSDGLLDARDAKGQMFSATGLDDFIQVWQKEEDYRQVLDSMLDTHCQHQLPEDDVTLVGLNLSQLAQLPMNTRERVSPPKEAQGWEWSLTSGGTYLLDHLDITSVMAGTHCLELLPKEQVDRLRMVLADLYNNALDHGLLGLESSMKSSPEGFQAYYEQREQALQSSPEGQVQIKLVFTPKPQGGTLWLEVKDSGQGYDVSLLTQLEHSEETTRLWGRGLSLVRCLTDSLTVHPPGNRVEAQICW